MVCSLPLKGGFIFKLAQDLNRSDGKAHLVVKAMLLDGKVEEAQHLREDTSGSALGTPRKSYFDLGERDMEGEAQEPCEIMLSLPVDCSFFR